MYQIRHWQQFLKNSLLLCLGISMCLLSVKSVGFFNTGEAIAKDQIAMGSVSANSALVIIGGNLRLDNEAIFKKIIDLGGGKGAKVAIMPTAASRPKKAGGLVVDTFNKYGANSYLVPIGVRKDRIDNIDYKEAVNDPKYIQMIKDANVVYFIGGDQARITKALYTEDGKNTPLLDAIWSKYRTGGVVGGSSAGAAIMSTTMFRDAQNVLKVLKEGVKPGDSIDKGIGFIGSDIFVDQHFLVRGRFARSLVVMRDKNYKMGIGVDENTAVVIKGKEAEVIGYKGAVIMDLSEATSNSSIPEFNIKNVKLSYLDQGDKFDFGTKIVTPSSQKVGDLKIDPNDPKFDPYFEGDKFFGDILANTALYDLMSNLIDNKQKEVIGVAFNKAPDAKDKELGFEFKFRKGKDSLGYYTGAFGGEDYTVMNIYLDVVPVKVVDKIYYPKI